MQLAIVVSVAGLAITVMFASLQLSNRLGRLEERIETMWQWWLTRNADVRVGGRRRTDIAADKK